MLFKEIQMNEAAEGKRNSLVRLKPVTDVAYKECTNLSIIYSSILKTIEKFSLLRLYELFSKHQQHPQPIHLQFSKDPTESSWRPL